MTKEEFIIKSSDLQNQIDRLVSEQSKLETEYIDSAPYKVGEEVLFRGDFGKDLKGVVAFKSIGRFGEIIYTLKSTTTGVIIKYNAPGWTLTKLKV